MSERPQFCIDCPYLPEGVEAEVTGADVVIMEELAGLHERERIKIAARVAGKVRLRATVTKSTKPGTDVGDEAGMLVQSEGRSPREIASAIGRCQGPQKSLIDKALGRRGTCPAAKRV